ncbi:MAG: FeoB small GTPase domain-containing protein, partial [Lentisphaeria bacterium]
MKKIAVAGNPNSGKSSLFNSLTGAKQHVANYAGVTVELSSGVCKVDNEKITLVDLPGTYSLTAYSQEEMVARDYIINERPDAVVVVLDASNLERNLYFLVQILELKVPVVVALNMVDVAESKGFVIDHLRMGELLGVKVIPTIAAKAKGINDLKTAMLTTAKTGNLPKPLMYGHEIQVVFDDLRNDLANCSFVKNGMDLDWLALKLLMDDVKIIQQVDLADDKQLIISALAKAKNYIRLHSDEETQTAVTEARYGIASGIVKECQRYTEAKRQNFTDKIDAIVCNRVLGPIFMLGFIYLLFTFAFNLAEEIQWIPLFNGE